MCLSLELAGTTSPATPATSEIDPEAQDLKAREGRSGDAGSGIQGSAAVGLGLGKPTVADLLPVQNKGDRKSWKRREDG
jgi:hypothetical protein